MKLNNIEEAEYHKYITSKIENIPRGRKFFFRDFFAGRTASIRIARKFYEDVVSGAFTNVNVRLVGTLSNEGYEIF